MKKVYEAPKAVKHSFEAKDIITASRSRMLSVLDDNSTDEIMSIDWSDWGAN